MTRSGRVSGLLEWGAVLIYDEGSVEGESTYEIRLYFHLVLDPEVQVSTEQ